jgi:HSP20 family protein
MNNSNVVKAEMPGVEKKDITVAVENGVLTVTGERSAEDEFKEDSLHLRHPVNALQLGSVKRIVHLAPL